MGKKDVTKTNIPKKMRITPTFVEKKATPIAIIMELMKFRIC